MPGLKKIKQQLMSRNYEIIRIDSTDQIPSIHTIRAYPRDKELRLIFNKPVQDRRESIGNYLKKKLAGFQVGIHLCDPIIIIAKLISEEEVVANQAFFEQCAKDYRNLAGQLIYQLANQFNINIDPTSPMSSFHKLRQSKKSSGTMGQWKYGFHGIHCRFDHELTKQIIEVSLMFGLEFGELDPYFFTRFILSTQAYHPLTVDIFEEYADGVIINNTMLSIGKFEQIQSVFQDRTGIVVSDREKISVQSLKMEDSHSKSKSTFNLFTFLRLRNKYFI